MRSARILRDTCPNGDDCPRIHELDDGRLAVQGDKAEPDLLTQLAIPATETLSIVPRELLPEVTVPFDLHQLGALIKERHTSDLFRLEALAHYDAASDDEDYHRYLHGEQTPNAEAKQPWLDRLRAEAAAGRRVHAIRHPLSDYLRYECEWGYTYNVAAGEDVRILDLDALNLPGLAASDYFVIDNEQVVRSNYDDSGRFVSAEVVSGPSRDAYRALANLLWHSAEPFATWWSAHPQYHRDGQVA